MLAGDWVALAKELDLTDSDINIIKSQYPDNIPQQAIVMLRLWMQTSGNKATGNTLEKALRSIHRDDIVDECICNLEVVTDDMEKEMAKERMEQSTSLLNKAMESGTPIKKATSNAEVLYDEKDIMKEAESAEEDEEPRILQVPNGREEEVSEIPIVPEPRTSTTHTTSQVIVEPFVEPHPEKIVEPVLVENVLESVAAEESFPHQQTPLADKDIGISKPEQEFVEDTFSSMEPPVYASHEEKIITTFKDNVVEDSKKEEFETMQPEFEVTSQNIPEEFEKTTTHPIHEVFETSQPIQEEIETTSQPMREEFEIITEPSHESIDKTSQPTQLQFETDVQPIHEELTTATQPIREEFETLAQPIHEEFETIAEPIREEFETTTQPIREEFETIAQPIREEFETLAQPIHEEFETMVEPIREEFETTTQPIREEFETIAQPIREEFETIAQPIHKEFETIVQPIQEEFETIAQPIQEEFKVTKPILEEFETSQLQKGDEVLYPAQPVPEDISFSVESEVHLPSDDMITKTEPAIQFSHEKFTSETRPPAQLNQEETLIPQFQPESISVPEDLVIREEVSESEYPEKSKETVVKFIHEELPSDQDAEFRLDSEPKVQVFHKEFITESGPEGQTVHKITTTTTTKVVSEPIMDFEEKESIKSSLESYDPENESVVEREEYLVRHESSEDPENIRLLESELQSEFDPRMVPEEFIKHELAVSSDTTEPEDVQGDSKLISDTLEDELDETAPQDGFTQPSAQASQMAQGVSDPSDVKPPVSSEDLLSGPRHFEKETVDSESHSDSVPRPEDGEMRSYGEFSEDDEAQHPSLLNITDTTSPFSVNTTSSTTSSFTTSVDPSGGVKTTVVTTRVFKEGGFESDDEGRSQMSQPEVDETLRKLSLQHENE